MTARIRWPGNLGEMMAFVYTPERWARAHRLIWSRGLERTRRFVLGWLYQRSGTPMEGPDGRRIVVPVKRRYSSNAPWVVHMLNDAKYPPDLTEELERMTRDESHEMIETERFMVSGPAHLVEGLHTPAEATALRGIEKQGELAASRQWKVCLICGRPFPAFGKTESCPPCRRRFTRRQVQWRLAHAPEDPVVFRYFNPNEEPQFVYMCIEEGVRAPSAVRCLTRGPVGTVFTEKAVDKRFKMDSNNVEK